MTAFLALVLNAFREARRNRVTLVVAGFALLSLMSSSLAMEVVVSTFDRVLVDVGLGSMAMILVALAIYLSCGVVPQEIERKTIFLIVSRPVSRTSFLVARLLGNVLTLTVLTLGMSAVLLGVLVMARAPITQPFVMSLLGLVVELAVISAAGFLFSSFSSTLVSAGCTAGVYFAGHLSAEIWRTSARSSSTFIQWLGKLTYYVMPNLERVNFRTQATYAVDVPLRDLGTGVGLSLAYVVVFMVLAAIIFERRDFK